MTQQTTYQQRIAEYIANNPGKDLGIMCHPENVEKFEDFPELTITTDDTCDLDGYMIGNTKTLKIHYDTTN